MGRNKKFSSICCLLPASIKIDSDQFSNTCQASKWPMNSEAGSPPPFNLKWSKSQLRPTSLTHCKARNTGKFNLSCLVFSLNKQIIDEYRKKNLEAIWLKATGLSMPTKSSYISRKHNLHRAFLCLRIFKPFSRRDKKILNQSL